MTEYTLIRVQRFRTPDGAQTCASGPTPAETCKFMTRVGLRGSELCGALKGAFIDRADGNQGLGLSYTIPLEHCPVWTNAK